jgi:hypothetical protein
LVESHGRKSWKFWIVESDKNLGIGNVSSIETLNCFVQISLFLLIDVFKSSERCLLLTTKYKMMGPDDKPIMMIPPDDNEPCVT